MKRMKFRLAACIAALVVGATVPAAAEQVRSARVVTSSDDLQLTKSDHTIGLKRTVKPHKTVVMLPSDAEPDQEFVIDDLAGNFYRVPVTVLAPDGHTFLNNKRAFGLVIDWGHTAFRYFGDKTWGAEQ
jgi:hypothetical protein